MGLTLERWPLSSPPRKIPGSSLSSSSKSPMAVPNPPAPMKVFIGVSKNSLHTDLVRFLPDPFQSRDHTDLNPRQEQKTSVVQASTKTAPRQQFAGCGESPGLSHQGTSRLAIAVDHSPRRQPVRKVKFSARPTEASGCWSVLRWLVIQRTACSSRNIRDRHHPNQVAIGRPGSDRAVDKDTQIDAVLCNRAVYSSKPDAAG